MNKSLEEELVQRAREKQTQEDPSHDFQHVWRVYQFGIKIGKKERADFDVLIPASLFHDSVVYPKNHPNSKYASEESAEFAKTILENIRDYPAHKIGDVVTCIQQCSFSKGIQPELLEAKILQDADRLEATGAIAIMRTFSSGGQMNRPFYNLHDPFCEKGAKELNSGIDLFYTRLLVVEKGMHTRLARKIAKRRTRFLRKFLKELARELKELGIV